MDPNSIATPLKRLHPRDHRRRPRGRQARRPRPHAVSAGAERLPAHRPRQVDLPELRPRRGVRRQVQPALRRHQPDQGRAGVRRVDPATTSAGSASTGRAAMFYASDYFEQLYEWAEQLIQDGQGVRLRPDGRRDPRVPRHAQPSRARTARTATAPVEENLDLFQRMRAGEFPDGARTLRAKIDMASPEHQPARPGDVPHPARAAPPHRRQVVHLPDVRLRARPSPTRSRASRTRSARWSSRTTGRCTTGSSRTLGIYHPQQIEFARLNLTYTVMSKRKLLQLVQREARHRLGRPAHADDLRPAPPRLHAGGDPRRSASGSASPKFNSSIDIGAARGLRPRGPEQAARRA